MRTMLRRWLGIEDAVDATEILKDQHGRLVRLVESHINFNNQQALIDAINSRNKEVDIAIEGLRLLDEINSIRCKWNSNDHARLASQLRFLSRFIGATNKKGGGYAQE